MAHETILIVEDDPKALELMTDLLTQEKYRILTAQDGPQALKLAKEAHPDLILMDVQLPGLNGLAVARQLKEDPATALIPIVAVTAMTLDRTEAEAMVRDCVGYIPKPVSPRSLIGLVPAFLQAGKRRQGG
ncbi:MAG: response regulator [candidate division NC10 bacterium]|nr:response regulator [candidate division NC10 bacterium]